MEKMNGEHVDVKDQTSDHMFPKLHQTHKFNSHPPLQSQHHQHYPQSTHDPPEGPDDLRTPAGNATPAKRKLSLAATAAASNGNPDGATIEIFRRPRGRPPGSKNKPKPPVVVTRDGQPSMSAYVLELPGGVDVPESVTRFCRTRNTGICVLTGSGTVGNVTLKQSSIVAPPGSTVTFHGRFEILSLSATVFPPSATSSLPISVANGFTISLAGPQGQVVGGSVSGGLMTAGTVYLIAATFNSPSFRRLPLEQEEVRSSVSGGGKEGKQSPTAAEGGQTPASLGMSIYGCHVPSEVIFAPTARQPPPY